MRSMPLGGSQVTSLLTTHRPRASASALRLVTWVVAVAAGSALLACESVGAQVTACDRPATEEPWHYDEGSRDDGVYMTSGWYGELLYFPGGAHYRIHHRLGEVPHWFQFYLSFERDGLGSGSLAQAAGNQVEVKAIDDETITVINGSCVDYWLLGVVGVSSDGP